MSDKSLQRFDELLGKSCELALMEQEQQELAELLRGSSQLRKRYLAYTQLDAVLWLTSAGSERDAGVDAMATLNDADAKETDAKQSEAKEANANEIGEQTSAKPPLPIRSFWPVNISGLTSPLSISMLISGAVIAGSILLLAFWTLPDWKKRQQAQRDLPDSVAVLSATENAVWSHHSDHQNSGADLKTGDRLLLLEGAADIEFADGAIVQMRGPCDLVVESASIGKLQNGIVVATVPPSAVGFTLRTWVADIVDLGTIFSANVIDATTTEVSVLVGSVRVSNLNEELVLHEGEAARVVAKSVEKTLPQSAHGSIAISTMGAHDGSVLTLPIGVHHSPPQTKIAAQAVGDSETVTTIWYTPKQFSIRGQSFQATRSATLAAFWLQIDFVDPELDGKNDVLVWQLHDLGVAPAATLDSKAKRLVSAKAELPVGLTGGDWVAFDLHDCAVQQGHTYLFSVRFESQDPSHTVRFKQQRTAGSTYAGGALWAEKNDRLVVFSNKDATFVVQEN